MRRPASAINAQARADARGQSTAKANKPVEVFSYTVGTTTTYVVEVSRVVTGAGVTETITLQPVDIDAAGLGGIEVGVKADVPVAVEYDHIHFGVWSGLTAANKNGAQQVADLGIGFVQNFSGSGVTEGLGIGKASYNGDWVAIIQQQASTAAGTFYQDNGAAKLTADFDKDKFTAALTGLATLEGALDGNGFSGTKATTMHNDLDSSGTFAGEFSGNIYGAKGTESRWRLRLRRWRGRFVPRRVRRHQPEVGVRHSASCLA